MKRLIAGRRSQVALTAALALLMVGGLSSAAQATNAPSSSDPEQCKNGGWQNLTTSTGAPFANQGDCVSYAAQGGVLYPTPSLSLTFSACEVAEEGPGGRILNCTGEFVGSGLKPGEAVVYCSPGVFECGPIGTVAQDGTFNLGPFPGFFCVENAVVTVSSTTAAGNPIMATDTCS